MEPLCNGHLSNEDTVCCPHYKELCTYKTTYVLGAPLYEAQTAGSPVVSVTERFHCTGVTEQEQLQGGLFSASLQLPLPPRPSLPAPHLVEDGAGCVWCEGAAWQKGVGPLSQGDSRQACGHSSTGSEVRPHLAHLNFKGVGSP